MSIRPRPGEFDGGVMEAGDFVGDRYSAELQLCLPRVDAFEPGRCLGHRNFHAETLRCRGRQEIGRLTLPGDLGVIVTWR